MDLGSQTIRRTQSHMPARPVEEHHGVTKIEHATITLAAALAANPGLSPEERTPTAIAETAAAIASKLFSVEGC